MFTENSTKAQREYRAILNDQSLSARERIDAALNFDADRKPGVVAIREHQAQLAQERQQRINRARCELTIWTIRGYVQRRIRDESGGDSNAAQYFNLPAERRARWTRKWAEAGTRWLDEIADAAQGYPRRIFDTYYPPCERLLHNLPAGDGTYYARVGEWLVRPVETVTTDWHKYSKKWHRAHGPARTVERRTVQIRRYDMNTRVVINRDVEIDSWRGNWAMNALITSGILRAERVPVRLRPVQLHEGFEIVRLRGLGGVEIYERRLAGAHYDYCALWHGLTFHAATPRQCVTGLRAKLAAVEQRKNAPINLKFCRELGFCEEGIRQFAADFDLDAALNYSAAEIAAALRGQAERAHKYLPELKKLAQATGYDAPELTA